MKKVAVLGAGVMGAQIAALFSESGFHPYLYDLPIDGASPNIFIEESLDALKTFKPKIIDEQYIANIIPCNYKDDLKILEDCDLIIEAVSEQIGIKQELYNMVSDHINSDAILASNTSGLSIHQLSYVLPEKLIKNFIGIHFFNPPKYMHLVELIPHDKSDPHLVSKIQPFLENILNRKVILAKDTPNFIGNRIGFFALLSAIYNSKRYKIPIDMVDMLCGELVNRPKSAVFRTLDLIGLDTSLHIVQSLFTQLGDDPWHFCYKFPDWIIELIDKGILGNKTKGGIYKKINDKYCVYEPKDSSYRPVIQNIPKEIKEIFLIENYSERFSKLRKSKTPEAKFLYSCYVDLWHYSTFHVRNIASSLGDIDIAMEYGYGWKIGPIETANKIGWDLVCNWMIEDIPNSIGISNTPFNF